MLCAYTEEHMTIFHTDTYRGYSLAKVDSSSQQTETLFWTVTAPTTIPELLQPWTTKQILKQRIDLYKEHR
jgi:hypothetical protein